MITLHASEQAALEHVAAYARARQAEARATLAEVRAMCNLAPAEWERAVEGLRRHARVALHFHPDRPDERLRTVAEGLLEHGVYKSQFETLMSNGSVSAFAGGARDRWEERLFGGAYQRADSGAAQRPKYGALDLLRAADGPAPRFGSCYFVLAPAVTARATFTYLDSHDDRREKGTLTEFDDILAALFAESFTRDFAIGEPLRPRELVARLAALAEPYRDAAARPPSRNLNHYIEAQVHGPVRLDDDVELLVADASFRGSAVAATLQAIAARYRIALFWHDGFALAPAEVPDDFRGPAMPSLAARVAVDGVVHAAAIGRACQELRREPAAWADRGGYAEVLQELKLLWHVLVRCGRPFAA